VPLRYDADPRTEIERRAVSAGPFLFGPAHEVRELQTFLVGATPVTNGEYTVFVAATRRAETLERTGPPVEIADHPVVFVSWFDARAFAEWIGGRLLTEEEWTSSDSGKHKVIRGGAFNHDRTLAQPCRVSPAGTSASASGGTRDFRRSQEVLKGRRLIPAPAYAVGRGSPREATQHRSVPTDSSA
jgi:hypothetical protein